MGFFSAGPLFRGLWIVFSTKSLEKFKNYNHNQVEIRVLQKKIFNINRIKFIFS
jgi:hypothetical protein